MNMKMNYHTSDNDGSASAMQSIELEHAAKLKAEYESKVLAEKFRIRPCVRQYKKCSRELQDEKDFSAISAIGIELAARHIAEVLKKPDAVLMRAYWPDESLWIVYGEMIRGREVEGLFQGLPAYEDGHIMEAEFHVGDIDLVPAGYRDELLVALGYPAAWANEIEELLVQCGLSPMEAMRNGLEEATSFAVAELNKPNL